MTADAPTLDPWQVESVAWLLAHPRGGLGDEMRVGKTAPAIVAAVQAGARNVLVLTPPNVVTYWLEQIALWGSSPDDIVWEVVSMDTFWRRPLPAVAHDTIILDEVHQLRNHTAKRSRAVWGPQARGNTTLLENATRVWALTGTPMVNDAGDLWAMFRAMGWTTLTRMQWLDRYCITRETKFGTKVIGNNKTTLPELRKLFRTHFIRRMFAEVHKGRPEPLLWRAKVLDASAWSRELEELDRDPEIQALVRKITGTSLEEDVVINAALKEKLSKLRRLTATIKAPLTIDHAMEYLAGNPDRKALILGWHTEPLEAIAEGLPDYNPVMFTGGTSAKDRENAKRWFQTDPLCRVFVGNIVACGTGIDLSRADVVMFHETSWVPGDNVQAAMRAVNRDKDHPTPVDLIALAGSVDEAVTRVRVKKMQMMSDVYRDEPEPDERESAT